MYITTENKTVTPSSSAQTVYPSTNKVFGTVTVGGIPSSRSYGGTKSSSTRITFSGLSSLPANFIYINSTYGNLDGNSSTLEYIYLKVSNGSIYLKGLSSHYGEYYSYEEEDEWGGTNTISGYRFFNNLSSVNGNTSGIKIKQLSGSVTLGSNYISFGNSIHSSMGGGVLYYLD